MGRRPRRLEPAPAAGVGRRGGLGRPRGEPAVRHGAARERGRRRSAYEAPHGSVAPGPASSGAESKRRRCPRSRARTSRVTPLIWNDLSNVLVTFPFLSLWSGAGGGRGGRIDG